MARRTHCVYGNGAWCACVTRHETTPFTFETLDGLAFAGERGLLEHGAVPPYATHDIGPIVEMYQVAACNVLPRPHAAPWLTLGALHPFVTQLDAGCRQWVSRGGIGFLRTASQGPQDETTWTAFGLEVQRAASRAGFTNPIAAQLTAALGELYSNIYEHSRRSGTGLIAFKSGKHAFEIVVADRGVGVLDSLRTHGEYGTLADHGEALHLTLTEGVSRYGEGTGRGYGFRPLFIGLANIRGALRFRSGDHALVIDGTSPTLVTARSAQKVPVPGFMVAVKCGTPGTSTMRS